MLLDSSMVPAWMERGITAPTAEELRVLSPEKPAKWPLLAGMYSILLAITFTLVFLSPTSYVVNIFQFVLYLWFAIATVVIPLLWLGMFFIYYGEKDMAEKGWTEIGKSVFQSRSKLTRMFGIIFSLIMLFMLAGGGYYYGAFVVLVGFITGAMMTYMSRELGRTLLGAVRDNQIDLVQVTKLWITWKSKQ
jgi:hypothetical protein